MSTSRFLTTFGRMPPRRLDAGIRLCCLVLLVGLIVKSVLFAHWGLVAALVVLAISLAVNLVLPTTTRAQASLDILFISALTATVLLVTVYLGTEGAIWLFPAIVGMRFISVKLRTGLARVALLVLVPLILAFQGDVANAGRVFAGASIVAFYLWLAEGELVPLRTKLDRDEGRDPLTRAFTRERLERDAELIPQLAPVGVLLIRLEGITDQSWQGRDQSSETLIAHAAAQLLPLLSRRERLYRVAREDFLIALSGWRPYESFELGEQLREVLVRGLPQGITPRVGVTEITEVADFNAALLRVYKDSGAEAPPA
ncbi:GGDEF domain-containing protein [Phaeobacter sp. HF9A]|uniref:GGDEF domain-containing protein n=1 Tax=Phaeobacter sp. HF9A TaxID=2721561 RepID=UPI00142FB4F3|nr:GGDEF domain-containing protein [Phaeobacter sp. HF9A]NIZ14055.1 GGDEF domain-containing protein [Phaeobacter sp. HF9A]